MANKNGITKQAKQLGIDLEEVETEELKFVPPKAADLDAENDRNMDDFNALLDSMSTTEAKKKSLWKQIYQNALIDRRNAYVLFGDLYNMVAGDASAHGVHGINLSKYLERMSKANDQLIKLADLVDEESQAAEEAMFNNDSLYDQINRS